MIRKTKWTIEVDGIQHNIQYKQGFKCKVIVDGKEEILKSRNPIIILIDKSIDLGGKKVQLVVRGMKLDLAVDGVYLNSGKQYVPIDNLPKWGWVFIGACILPMILCLGGVINMGMAAIGATLCMTNTMSQKRPTSVKVIINIIITIFVWAIDLMMILFATSI